MHCARRKANGTVDHRPRTTESGRRAGPHWTHSPATTTGARSLACRETAQPTDHLDLTDSRLVVDLGDAGREIRVLIERGEIAVDLVSSSAPFVEHRTDGRDGIIVVVEEGSAATTAVYEALEHTRDHEDWAGKRHPRHLQRVETIQGPGRLEVGTAFTTRQRTRKGLWLDRSVVEVATPSRAFAFRTQGVHVDDAGHRTAAGAWKHRYLLEACERGTVVRYTCRYSLSEGRVEPHAAPFITINVHRRGAQPAGVRRGSRDAAGSERGAAPGRSTRPSLRRTTRSRFPVGLDP